MTEYIKTGHNLPDDTKNLLTSLDVDTRNNYIWELHSASWTYQSIADVLGVSRERVRQVAAEPSTPTGYALPEPPRKVVKTPRVPTAPDAEKIQRARELQPLAKANRASLADNKRAAEEYTLLLWQMHDQDGVSIYRLAQELGVTTGAVRSRLIRYGYLLPKSPVTSKAYTRINPANRIAV